MSRGQRRGRTCGMEYPGLTSLLLFLLLGTMEANPYGKSRFALVSLFFVAEVQFSLQSAGLCVGLWSVFADIMVAHEGDCCEVRKEHIACRLDLETF